MPGTSAPTGAYTQPQPLALDRGLHRLGHAVEHLHLEAGVGDALRARVGHRVGERAEVVGAERGPHLAVVVVQEPHAALVVGVGLVLALEHRHRPALGLGLDGLGVPVRPFTRRTVIGLARCDDHAMRSARSSRLSFR